MACREDANSRGEVEMSLAIGVVDVAAFCLCGNNVIEFSYCRCQVFCSFGKGFDGSKIISVEEILSRKEQGVYDFVLVRCHHQVLQKYYCIRWNRMVLPSILKFNVLFYQNIALYEKVFDEICGI